MTKRRKRTIESVAAVCLFILLPALTARADVALRYAPDPARIEPGTSGRLSVMIDVPLEVRTIDVVVTYDPEIVLSVGGGAGALYTESGVFTFQGFENETPGEWHGYAVLMGAGLFVQGPGELYYWDFEGLVEGYSWIETVEVALAATDASLYEGVTLETGLIIVGDWSSVTGTPPAAVPPLRISPNPFNPGTVIELPPGDGRPATLSVLDVRGRLVRELWSGVRTADTGRFSWDGMDSNGLEAGSGPYLFVLSRDGGPPLVGRGSLVR